MTMTSYGESIEVVNMCCSQTYWHRVVSRCLKRRAFFFFFRGVETCDSTCVSFLQVGLFYDSALGNPHVYAFSVVQEFLLFFCAMGRVTDTHVSH